MASRLPDARCDDRSLIADVPLLPRAYDLLLAGVRESTK